MVGVCFGQIEYNENDIVEQNGIWMKKFSDEKVNGRVFYEYEGNKIILGSMINGKKNGKWTFWYDSGIKRQEAYFKDGRNVGEWKWYNSQGILVIKQSFSNVDNLSTKVSYDINGNEIAKGIIKGENRHYGKFIEYKGNFVKGEYEIDGHSLYKDSELVVVYYFDENGDTSKVGTLVNGELEFSSSKNDKNIIETNESLKKEYDIPYDSPPLPKGAIRPVYPEQARLAGTTGMVVVQAYINEKGRVTETHVLKGIPNTGLNEAAVKAIKKTRFRPAKKGRKKVGAWISIPVNFN